MRSLYATLLLLLACCGCSDAERFSVFAGNTTDHSRPSIDTGSFALRAQQALLYAQSRKMSTNRCLLIDMSIHSGLNRLIEWDFNNSTIVSATLVTHGCGTAAWASDRTRKQPAFSNVPESHLSSLGRYSIGERGPSQWGIGVKYLLHGLDTTNSNALKRYVVFHSWNKVKDTETYPSGAPESWGCPAVSDNYMRYIDSVLQQEKRPVLLWIYH